MSVKGGCEALGGDVREFDVEFVALSFDEGHSFLEVATDGRKFRFGGSAFIEVGEGFGGLRDRWQARP